MQPLTRFTLALSALAASIMNVTASDANWVTMNPTIPGASGTVSAAAVDAWGNLYVGGNFTLIGGTVVNGVAKWDGSSWTTLGSGVNAAVWALAVVGSDLYVGGNFTTAGGNSCKGSAKWDGSHWSAVGSGFNGSVLALAVSGSIVYAGGSFRKDRG